ncbi:heme-binding protein [Marinobacter sp.]|uniref:GlcG/HbpS family heme-binding protein n=1 Tax=Marinobacter sp. TaxID=50741 RepID=UPI0019B2C271|nr:heme-binding protein [Marinobacter sp.]MBD3654941.1 heme-binding protein [Marinobacter sp.]
MAPNPAKPLVQAHLTLTESAILGLLQAAVSGAESLGFAATVAVTDTSGLLLGFLRMPGSFLVSSEMSKRKARCAAGLGIDAAETEEVLSHEDPRVRCGLLSSHNFTLIRGGLPLYWGDVLIGGIGVSGGSESQDLACAKAAVAAVEGFAFGREC